MADTILRKMLFFHGTFILIYSSCLVNMFSRLDNTSRHIQDVMKLLLKP